MRQFFLILLSDELSIQYQVLSCLLVVTDSKREIYTESTLNIFATLQLKRQESLEFLNQNVSSFEQQAVLFPHKTAHDIFIFEA